MNPGFLGLTGQIDLPYSEARNTILACLLAGRRTLKLYREVEAPNQGHSNRNGEKWLTQDLQVRNILFIMSLL